MGRVSVLFDDSMHHSRAVFTTFV